MQKIFNPPNFRWEENNENINLEVQYPIDYFNKYITSELFEDIVKFTNIYALQQGKSQIEFKPTNKAEIETLFGLHIIIGCLNKFPRLRMYWNATLSMNVFLENMSRNRFFQIRTMLQFVNNLERPYDCTDKFYKVRPLMDAVLKRCRELEIGQFICISR